MKFLEAIFSGGLLGILGQVAVGWLESWRADKESARKIAEMKALQEMKVEEAAWGAFAVAQKATELPAGVPGWVSAVVTLTRPSLTFLLLCFVAYVYATAALEVRADMTKEITACGFGAVWFWFGSRYQSRIRAK